MVAFGRKGLTPHEASGIEQRSAARSALVMAGNMDTTIARHSVTLIDISESGAQLSGSNLAEVGQFVHLKVGECMAFCTVVWRRGDECGVAFDRPLAKSRIDKFRAAAREVAHLGLDPEQQLARQIWTSGQVY